MKVAKKVHIIGGGTVAYIANHLAISAPAYGATARTLDKLVQEKFIAADTYLHLTKMADTRVKGSTHDLETNEDVKELVDRLVADPTTKVIFFNCALVDFSPYSVADYIRQETGQPALQAPRNVFGKYESRINTRRVEGLVLELTPSEKLVSTIRQKRKDIFLVAFKTTCGATKEEMYTKGLSLCKEASVNLVLVNDVKTRWNMIVTPEEAAYGETGDREQVLKELVDMTYLRSQLTFTQSTVIAGKTVRWDDERIPEALRRVVEHCADNNAYKRFNGATVGHFAVKLSETEFLTSIRKSDLACVRAYGLVYVKTDGPDTVLAYGAKPSVGGQSQRIVFKDHPGMDCIVHFHCPLRKDAPDKIPIRSQYGVECGSHECGKNTSDGLESFGNLKAVYLDMHGPNIVFNHQINPQEVIDFIERNFDLSQKTGGYNLPDNGGRLVPFSKSVFDSLPMQVGQKMILKAKAEAMREDMEARGIEPLPESVVDQTLKELV